MFGEFQSTGTLVLDILRWISIVWLVFGMSWLVQIAVINKSPAVTFLSAGLALSLFVDLSDQYERVGANSVAYRLPIIYILMILVSAGMYRYVKDLPDVKLPPPYFFLVREKPKKKSEDEK